MAKRTSKADRSADESPDKVEFEFALKQLEDRVKLLEQGNLPLDQSLQQYAQAVQLIAECQSQLDSAERKIELLCGFDSAGNPVVQSIDHQGDLSLDEKQAARSQRRTVKSNRAGKSRPEEPCDGEEDQRLF